MMALVPSKPLIVALLFTVGLTVPLVWHWYVVGRAPGVEVREARALADDGSAMLVRVEEMPANEGLYWPMAEILRSASPADIPIHLRDQKLLLLCTGGVHSAQAARHLSSLGVADVYSIRGGWQEWISVVPGCPAGVAFSRDPAMNAAVPVFRPSPLHEQWAVVIAFFGIKFVYSAAAAGLWYLLRRSTAPDLLALRWSMLLFFIGEGFCFINVMAFAEHSMLLEHLHSVGMVLSLGFAWWAAIEAVDTRIIHYSDEQRCALVSLCHGCAKHANVACGLRRVFLLTIPLLAALALMPLFSELRETAYNTRVLSALHSYRHPILHQLYEVRYLPLASVVLLAGSMLMLLTIEKRSVVLAKVLFAAGLGAMSFSLLRLSLMAWYEENQVWFAFWEEATELLYIAAVAGALWAFRRGLFPATRITGEAHAVTAA